MCTLWRYFPFRLQRLHGPLVPSPLNHQPPCHPPLCIQEVVLWSLSLSLVENIMLLLICMASPEMKTMFFNQGHIISSLLKSHINIRVFSYTNYNYQFRTLQRISTTDICFYFIFQISFDKILCVWYQYKQIIMNTRHKICTLDARCVCKKQH